MFWTNSIWHNTKCQNLWKTIISQRRKLFLKNKSWNSYMSRHLLLHHNNSYFILSLCYRYLIISSSMTIYKIQNVFWMLFFVLIWIVFHFSFKCNLMLCEYCSKLISSIFSLGDSNIVRKWTESVAYGIIPLSSF